MLNIHSSGPSHKELRNETRLKVINELKTVSKVMMYKNRPRTFYPGQRKNKKVNLNGFRIFSVAML